MRIDTLKNEAKRLGLRVTKKIRGKRVPLSEKELKMKIERRRPPSLEIQVRDSKKLLRTCKSLLRTVNSNVPRIRRVSQTPRVQPVRKSPPVSRAPPIPPAPPVPPRPMARNPRANLMTALKANLKRRGLKEKINQTS